MLIHGYWVREVFETPLMSGKWRLSAVGVYIAEGSNKDDREEVTFDFVWIADRKRSGKAHQRRYKSSPIHDHHDVCQMTITVHLAGNS